MIENIRKMWKIPELRRKIIYTFLMLVLFRLISMIPAPGVNYAALKEAMLNGGTINGNLPLMDLVNMMTGSAFNNMTIMAMGITPYINASIIMQLLTIAIPALERLSKEEDGRQKINRITRYVTVVLAALQAIGLVRGIQSQYVESGWTNLALIGISMATGTALAIRCLLDWAESDYDVECLTPVYDELPDLDVLFDGYFSAVPYVIPGKYVMNPSLHLG